MSEFFLELFSEEIPANLQIAARENLLKEFKIFFEKESIVYKNEAKVLSTPNRLVVYFKDINIQQEYIFPYKIPEYKNYIYEKKDYFKVMPPELFKCLENNFGWHLCIKCIK